MLEGKRCAVEDPETFKCCKLREPSEPEGERCPSFGILNGNSFLMSLYCCLHCDCDCCLGCFLTLGNLSLPSGMEAASLPKRYYGGSGETALVFGSSTES